MSNTVVAPITSSDGMAVISSVEVTASGNATSAQLEIDVTLRDLGKVLKATGDVEATAIAHSPDIGKALANTLATLKFLGSDHIMIKATHSTGSYNGEVRTIRLISHLRR